jgi:hypothetical protein
MILVELEGKAATVLVTERVSPLELVPNSSVLAESTQLNCATAVVAEKVNDPLKIHSYVRPGVNVNTPVVEL